MGPGARAFFGVCGYLSDTVSTLDDRSGLKSALVTLVSPVVEDHDAELVDVALRVEWEEALGFEASRSQEPDTTGWVVSRADMVPGVDELVCRRITVPRECTH